MARSWFATSTKNGATCCLRGTCLIGGKYEINRGAGAPPVFVSRILDRGACTRRRQNFWDSCPPPPHLHFQYCSSAKSGTFYTPSPSVETSYVHALRYGTAYLIQNNHGFGEISFFSKMKSRFQIRPHDAAIA